MKQRGILLIHGFAGDRNEILPLHDFLKSKGFIVLMPVLAGHEGTRSDLAHSRYHEWIQSAKKAYLQLAVSCCDVTVIGFSMGGLIAVQLYQEYHFNRLITINTPVYYWDIKRIALNLTSDFKTYFSKYVRSGANKPFAALLEFQKLLSQTKPLFQTVFCDSLIIQSQDDDTVNIKSADYIYRHIKGRKRYFKPALGGHVVFRSEHYAKILLAIERFLSPV